MKPFGDLEAETLCQPKNLSQLVGHSIKKRILLNWLHKIKKKEKVEERVCFVTGNTGCGKTSLICLALEQFDFEIKRFESSQLRIKKYRQSLYNYIQLADMRALVAKKKGLQFNLRRAILIEAIENIGPAFQEILRKIKLTFKKKHIIPVFFTRTKSYRGKKPLGKKALFLSLHSRSVREMGQILKHCLNTLPSNPSLNNLRSDAEQQYQLCKDCGGDVRRLLNHLKQIGENKDPIEWEINHERGIFKALESCFEEKDLAVIEKVTELEGSTPLAIHGEYLNCLKGINTKKHELMTGISGLLADYSYLLSKEREFSNYGLYSLARLLMVWGLRIEMAEKKVDPKRIVYWWRNQKKIEQKNVALPCFTKRLRISSLKRQEINKAFQKKSIAWSPHLYRYSKHLMALR